MLSEGSGTLDVVFRRDGASECGWLRRSANWIVLCAERVDVVLLGCVLIGEEGRLWIGGSCGDWWGRIATE